jgi:hypothetical protein
MNYLVDIILPSLVAVAIVAIAGYLIIWFFAKYEFWADNALTSILSLYKQPDKGSMYQVTFHTYYGFIFQTTQTKHIISFDPQDVKPTIELLRALLKFNLKYALLGYMGIFVPVLSYFEYRKAIKALRVHQPYQPDRFN